MDRITGSRIVANETDIERILTPRHLGIQDGKMFKMHSFLDFTQILSSAAMLIGIHCGATMSSKFMLELRNILAMEVK